MKKHNNVLGHREYKRDDLGKGVRGKYFKAYQKGSNLALLSSDVATAFPDDNAVNDALRSLLKIAQKSLHLTGRPIRRLAAHG